MYGEAFGEHAVTEYRAVQEREANNLLKGLLDDPDDFDRLISKYVYGFFPAVSWNGVTDHGIRFAGGIVADIGYGHRIESYEDEFFDIGERFIACAGTTNTPTLLDLHPVCTLVLYLMLAMSTHCVLIQSLTCPHGLPEHGILIS